MKRALAALVALLALAYGLFQLSRSRTFQVLGTLVARVDTTVGEVALTFDDGPQPGFTQQVLDVLAQRKARATFFLIGSEVDAHPAEARAISAAGHELGNHSYSHERMLFQSVDWMTSELVRTDAALAKAGAPGVPLFRPPYGKKLFTLPYVLWRAGRTAVTWDVEPESDPAIDGNADAITAHVLARARPGSIILLHPMYANRGATRDAVPRIVDGLHARGLKLVTVSELFARRR